MSSIGADGLARHGGHPPISSVVASGHGSGGSVTVKLPSRYWPDWLTVEASNLRADSVFVVKLHGGNTNDGDADYYEEAAALYAHAIEIARKLEQTISNLDWWHAGDFEPQAHALGQPDYVLALYLALKGEKFHYGRDVDDDEDHKDDAHDTRVVGLNTLRRMATWQITAEEDSDEVRP